jgi:hypothetical protein
MKGILTEKVRKRNDKGEGELVIPYKDLKEMPFFKTYFYLLKIKTIPFLNMI